MRRNVAQVFVRVVLVACGVAVSELLLRFALGLGHPVLYDSNPLYGFRPLPSQVVSRFGGRRTQFNNLGLRCDADWDGDPDRKILFLGDSVTFGGENLPAGELFVHLAASDLPGYSSCNGGVNAWGVENIYGLIVESSFVPARYYVSMLIEDDFYRGLVRVHGQLVWCREPALALEELWSYVCYVESNRRYKHWMETSRPETVDIVVEKAVRKLRDMDQFLKLHGFVHLIYVAETADDAVERAEEPLVLRPRFVPLSEMDRLPLALAERALLRAL